MGQCFLILDEPVVALDLEDILAELGYDVAAIAVSVREALQHIGNTDIGAAIMDVRIGAARRDALNLGGGHQYWR